MHQHIVRNLYGCPNLYTVLGIAHKHASLSKESTRGPCHLFCCQNIGQFGCCACDRCNGVIGWFQIVNPTAVHLWDINELYNINNRIQYTFGGDANY